MQLLRLLLELLKATLCIQVDGIFCDFALDIEHVSTCTEYPDSGA